MTTIGGGMPPDMAFWSPLRQLATASSSDSPAIDGRMNDDRSIEVLTKSWIARLGYLRNLPADASYARVAEVGESAAKDFVVRGAPPVIDRTTGCLFDSRAKIGAPAGRSLQSEWGASMPDNRFRTAGAARRNSINFSRFQSRHQRLDDRHRQQIAGTADDQQWEVTEAIDDSPGGELQENAG